MQALERKAPTKPMRPGLIERREFEYVHHGTQSAIVSFDIASGKVAHASIGPTRTEADFVAHIRETVASDPKASWVFIVDQLNTHQSMGLVELVAELCGLAQEVAQLKQERRLKCMVNRKLFLSDPAHRIQLIYTPTHTSWLNQIEIWFSILVRRVLKRGNFSSVEDLRSKVLAFIAYFNQAAKPFRWTFTGRPLVT